MTPEEIEEERQRVLQWLSEHRFVTCRLCKNVLDQDDDYDDPGFHVRENEDGGMTVTCSDCGEN